MKRKELKEHIARQGDIFSREGRRHSIYQKGRYRTQIPRHTEILDELARKICRDSNIPFVK